MYLLACGAQCLPLMLLPDVNVSQSLGSEEMAKATLTSLMDDYEKKDPSVRRMRERVTSSDNSKRRNSTDDKCAC